MRGATLAAAQKAGNDRCAADALLITCLKRITQFKDNLFKKN